QAATTGARTTRPTAAAARSKARFNVIVIVIPLPCLPDQARVPSSHGLAHVSWHMPLAMGLLPRASCHGPLATGLPSHIQSRVRRKAWAVAEKRNPKLTPPSRSPREDSGHFGGRGASGQFPPLPA